MASPAPLENETEQQIGPPIELAPTIAKYHFYNDLIAGTSSIILNLIMLFIVTHRLSSATKAFKNVMSVSKLCDILFSGSFIITAPICTSIALKPNFSALMIVNTGWQYNFTVDILLLSMAFVLLSQQIFLAPCLYYFRFAQVCRRDGIKCNDVWIIVFFNIVSQFFTATCFCYASLPSDEDIDLLEEGANKFLGVPSSFLLLSYTRHIDTVNKRINQIVSIISASGYLFSLVLSIVVMIFCTVKINLKVGSAKNVSPNLMAIQKRANLILLSQFFCPLIFIQVPFYYSILGPIVGLSQGLATDLVPLLFIWTPVGNDLIVFLLNKEIRNALVRKQKTTASSDARRSVN